VTDGPSDSDGDSFNEISGYVGGHAIQAGSIGVVNVVGTSAMRTRNQLGQPTSLWVNREEPLRALLAAGQRILISGLLGAGRTELAIKYHNENRDRFADAAIHIRATNSRGDLVPLGDMAQQALLAIGYPVERLPPAGEARAAAWRGCLGDRKVLLVLDDVQSAEQITPFLTDAPGLTVIAITGRPRGGTDLGWLVAKGFRLVNLAPLKTGYDLELVTRAADPVSRGIDTDTVKPLVNVCGGLPMSLWAMAGIMRASSPYKLRKLAREVATEGAVALGDEDRTGMIAPYEIRYRELPPDVAGSYRLLAAHPGPEFSAEAAAVVLDRELDAARDVLDDLVAAHLLTRIGEGRYRFHDLVWSHARECAEQHELAGTRAAALVRVARWYLLVATACAKVLSNRWRVSPLFLMDLSAVATVATRDAGLDWLETERENLLATLIALENLVRKPMLGPGTIEGVSLDTAICWFADALFPLYHLHRHFDDWDASHLIMLEAARRTGDPVLLMRVLSHLGSLHMGLGALDEAERCFHASLEAARLAGHAFGEQSALEWLGKVAAARGDHASALTYYEESRATVPRVPAAEQPRAYALLDLHIARVRVLLGHFAEAVTAVELARAYFDRPGDDEPERDNQAKTRYTHGEALAGPRQWDAAETVLREARALFVADHSDHWVTRVDELLRRIAEQRRQDG
jgi:tetratricopeptide (TPR) repeat protein